MKLLTLNTHSLIGEGWERRVSVLADALLLERVDVIALQEVNQEVSAPVLPACDGIFPRQDEIPLRQGNAAKMIVNALEERGLRYHWCWLPVKRGYGRYDEGLACLSLERIKKTECFFVSRRHDYESWKTRMVLGIQTENDPTWFFNLHMGWWQDEEEPFSEQWLRLTPHIEAKQSYWLMGDFNNPAHRRDEGYDLMRRYGLVDGYAMAQNRWGEGTATAHIDGWQGRECGPSLLRIDQIWHNQPIGISEYRTVFDGIRYASVSDHYGVMICVEDSKRK